MVYDEAKEEKKKKGLLLLFKSYYYPKWTADYWISITIMEKDTKIIKVYHTFPFALPIRRTNVIGIYFGNKIG